MRYQLAEEIGRGGTGIVFRAHDPVLERAVALKRIGRWTEADRTALEESVRLDHPNIVATYESWEEDGALWAATQLCEFSLATRPPGPVEIWSVGRCVADALVYAHARGLLHRDIKPSNVLGIGHRYLLSDFGAVGKLLDTGTTVGGEIAGTLLYMSPEQAMGRPQTVQSDLFGLGLLLYWCVFHEVPNQTEGLFGVLRARSTEQIRVPGQAFANPLLTPGLGELIASCLALDPLQRPLSAADFLEQLERLEKLRGVVVPPGPPIPPSALFDRHALPAPKSPARASVDATLRAAPPRPDPPPPSGAFPKSGVPWRIAAGIGIAGVILVAAVLLFSQTRSTPGDGPIGIYVAGRLALAALLIVGGLVAARWIRTRDSKPTPGTHQRATEILFGAGQRGGVTASLLIQVEQVVQSLKSADAGVVGITVRAMVHEYEAAGSSSDRQQALMNVVTLMEKIETRLSPWHVRHKEAIATATAVIGCLSGVASAVSGFLK